MSRQTGRALRRVAAALAATLLAGCASDEAVIAPQSAAAAGLFQRYVALGNSITAGFQSGGINDSTQERAYPVLLARMAHAQFGVPALAMPGCPPPLAVPLGPDRVGGSSAPECSLRATPPPALVQNLAVPDAAIADLLDNGGPESRANALTTLILGGRTQAEAMAEARPTLVSVWVGNNDVLDAADAGDPALATSLSSFQASLAQLVTAIRNTPAQDAVLIGVIDPLLAPFLQPGAFFFAALQAGLLPKPVSLDCSAYDLLGRPNPLAQNIVSFAAVTDASVPAISCAPDAPHVLSLAEVGTIETRVRDFNAAIESAANANDWIYIDPNAELLEPALADPSQLRDCQGLAAATTPDQFQAAVESTCPGPAAPNFFGSLVSYDGLHPSSAAQQIIANRIAAALDAKHGLALTQ